MPVKAMFNLPHLKAILIIFIQNEYIINQNTIVDILNFILF